MAKIRKNSNWVNPDHRNIVASRLIERYEALPFLMLRILLEEKSGPNYTFLRRMYNLLGINNEEIYEKSPDALAISHDSIAFFVDLATLIYDKAKEDRTVVDTFTEVIKSVYPTFSSIPSNLRYIKDYYAAATDIQWFRNNQKVISDVVAKETFGILLRKKAVSAQWSDSFLVFNTGEKVFEDPLYKKYLMRRLTELAEYCNEYYHRNDVTLDNLYEVLYEGMRSHSAQLEEMMHDSRTRTAYLQVYGGISNMASRTLYRNGGPVLLDETNPASLQEGGIYHPDMEALVNDFYREYVRIEGYKHITSTWNKTKDCGEEFSKLYLSRKCIPEPSYVLTCIHFLFNMDVLNHLYEKLKKRYYMGFSWEKVNYVASTQSLKDTISELQTLLKDYQTRLYSANEKIAFYKGQADSKVVKQSNASELNRLETTFEKEIDKKDAEIARLRKELELKNAYIELISQPEEETIFEVVDMDKLKSMRFLFVGRWAEAYPELKKTFPNSIFMDTVMKDISPEVDAVVFLIRCMSHSMFYKVQNDGSLKNIKRVYCNNRNINTLYADIFHACVDGQ